MVSSFLINFDDFFSKTKLKELTTGDLDVSELIKILEKHRCNGIIRTRVY